MRAGTPFVSLLHSAATYYSAGGGAAPEMHGKQIGFLGDRTNDTTPLPVLIQTKKAWEWFKGNVDMNAVGFAAHYTNEATNKLLWAPADSVLAERVAPRMLLIPSSLVEFMAMEQRTTGQLRAEVLRRANAPAATLNATDASLVLDWCVMAGQATGDGNSLLAVDPSLAYSNHVSF